ncbi:MAG: hypothetical protein SH856_11015 [Flavobacteriales bacterium]|nr:hypothetical protein [Flavobacteriales bacterium]
MKTKIHKACLQLLNEKIADLQKALNDLQQDTTNDSKSSAGDKHETSRAHMQIEYARISNMKSEALQQKSVLDKINLELISPRISQGSLIKIENGLFFLSIPLGKIEVEGTCIVVLSPQSPLGTKLLGAKAGDAVELNKMKYAIEGVC